MCQYFFRTSGDQIHPANVRIVFLTHLMIDEPVRYIDEFVDAGADLITVHAEACKHLDRTLHAIKDRGVLAGVALNRRRRYLFWIISFRSVIWYF